MGDVRWKGTIKFHAVVITVNESTSHDMRRFKRIDEGQNTTVGRSQTWTFEREPFGLQDTKLNW